ncbi:hypothetical protein [Priestia endophytica]|uniref:Uncharacterized protein n=1 Tax=Priestia endophytica DSM 13796 TaxID=1121089 RepID=A0A1I6BJ86_9BACI|nr:hypothetical protein [Priestia endophytica]SFQ81006.1 hypothetical protein SAMN02745910_03707 [Priestia endophytica DSM 13796]
MIEELWDRQYIQEVSSILKTHPFEVKNVTGTIGINRKDPIDIKPVPNIQEVRKKYGKEIMIDHIDIMLNDDYPLDSKQQEKENEKVFNFLQDLRTHNMGHHLALEITYKNSQQRYQIFINERQGNKYHHPEDMKKALIKTQKQVEQTYRK